MKRKLALALAVVILAGAIGALAADLTQAGAEGRQAVLAPIDELDVLVQESFPPRYVVHVVAGLPSGCAQRDRHEVTREGNTITVTVWNTMPTGDVACTMIYGMYELNIDLGTDFQSGATYTVRVNDRTITFVAQ